MSQPTMKPKTASAPHLFGQARSLVFLTSETVALLLLAG